MGQHSAFSDIGLRTIVPGRVRELKIEILSTVLIRVWGFMFNQTTIENLRKTVEKKKIDGKVKISELVIKLRSKTIRPSKMKIFS
jgi:hypothetical protein